MKKKKLSWHKDRAWKVFSQYIRYKADGHCYTCGKWYNWKTCHAGHLFHGALDFDERNVHCQCVRCNYYLHGNLNEYARRLVNEYGEGILEEMDSLKSIIAKRTRSDYDVIYKIYTDKLASLREANERRVR